MTNTELMELKIDFTPLEFITNLRENKEMVELELQKYDVAVTIENLQEAKKLAIKLNAFAAAFDNRRKEIEKEAKKPIDTLKAEVDIIVSLFKEGREKLLSQIKVFEDEKRSLCLKLLQEELEYQYDKSGIEPEFRTVKIDDLVIISNLTDTETLAKKAKNEIMMRTGGALAMQNLVQNRLLTLENASLKAGLKSPLERRHIESFLRESDSVYGVKLSNLIETEVKRQEEIEAKILKQEGERLRKEAEIKAQENSQKQSPIISVPAEPVKQVAEEPRLQIIAPAVATAPATIDILDEIEEPRIQRFVVAAYFEIECKNETTDTLKRKYWQKLSTDFKSIKNIEVSAI